MGLGSSLLMSAPPLWLLPSPSLLSPLLGSSVGGRRCRRQADPQWRTDLAELERPKVCLERERLKEDKNLTEPLTASMLQDTT